MDSQKNNAIFAAWLEIQAVNIAEQSEQTWNTVDKTKLPKEAFLWIENPEKRSSWHMPYRDGADGIDPATEEYRKAGAVNLNTLRAIAQVLSDTANTAMRIPPEIKSKIDKLFRRYKIGRFAESREDTNMGIRIIEASITKQFVESAIDTENCVVKNVAVLRPTSVNRANRKAKGRRYAARAMESALELIAGKKAYINHATQKDLENRGGVRDIRDTLGYWGDQAHIDESGVLRNDLHFLRNQAGWFVPMVEQMADKIGVSIHAFGDISYDEGDQMESVNDLSEMNSIDLVAEPGSTINLFESINDTEQEEELDIKTLTLTELREGRPDLIESIATEVQAKIDEKGTVEGLRGQIETLTTENKKLAEDLDKMQVAEAARSKEVRVGEVLSESGLAKEFITKTFRESLHACADEDKMKELIEDRKKLVGSAGKGVKDMGDETEIDESKDDETDAKEVDDDKFVAAFSR